ncbi:MAG: glycosyltransferase, partial [Thermoplasmata archaeon]
MPLIGGHENNVARLVRGLTRRGHETTVLTTPPANVRMGRRQFSVDSCEVMSVGVSSKYGTVGYILEVMTQLIVEGQRLHRRRGFQLFHGHSGFLTLASITGL